MLQPEREEGKKNPTSQFLQQVSAKRKNRQGEGELDRKKQLFTLQMGWAAPPRIFSQQAGCQG